MDITEAKQIIVNAQTTVPAFNTADIFANVKGMAMASVAYVTEVKLAKKSPMHGKIAKVTKASVSLANNLKEYTTVYLNKVKRTSEELVTDWIPTATYFHHTDTFCVTEHNACDGRFYLYALFNGAESMYINIVTGQEMSKQEVASYMAPAAAKKLLEDNSEVYNKTNDVTHNAIIRTVSLNNLASLTVQGNTYVGQFTYEN